MALYLHDMNVLKRFRLNFSNVKDAYVTPSVNNLNKAEKVYHQMHVDKLV